MPPGSYRLDLTHMDNSQVLFLSVWLEYLAQGFHQLVNILQFISVFGRAIHSLSKIGDELYFEPLEEGVCHLIFTLFFKFSRYWPNTTLQKKSDIQFILNNLNIYLQNLMCFPACTKNSEFVQISICLLLVFSVFLPTLQWRHEHRQLRG